MQKIKISQKEFDEIYDIEQPEITGETEVKGTTYDAPIPVKQDTTPFLTEEEQELNDKYLEDYLTPPEEEQALGD